MKQLHHIDGNHHNNEQDNLIWVSREMHKAIHKLQFEDTGNYADACAHNRLCLKGEAGVSGFKMPKEAIEKSRQARIGRKRPPETEETRRRKSISHLGIKRPKHAEMLKGVKQKNITCPNCNKTMSVNGYKRWKHAEKCKA